MRENKHLNYLFEKKRFMTGQKNRFMFIWLIKKKEKKIIESSLVGEWEIRAYYVCF